MTTRNSWPNRTYDQLDRESATLRNIAILLGSTEAWVDPAGILEVVATVIYGAGLPDPGNSENTEFYRAVR